MVSAVGDVVMAVDGQGQIVWIAPRAATHLGYDPEALVATSCFDLLHTDEHDLARVEWQRVLGKVNRQVPTTYRVRRADGSLCLMNVYARNHLDDPDLQAVVLSLDDVSRWADVDERQRQTAAFAHALLRGSPDLVLVLDDEGTIRYASPALGDMLGYSAAEFVGGPHLDLVHPDDRGSALALFRNPAEAGVAGGSAEVRIRHVDGRYRVLNMVMTDMRDDPVVGGFVFNVRDVTVRRHAEEFLAEQADLLEAIARGAPLEVTLQKIAQMIEHAVRDGDAALGTFEPDGSVHLRAAPGLPGSVLNAIDDCPSDTPLRRAMADDESRWELVSADALARCPGLSGPGRGACRVSVVSAPAEGVRLGVILLFTPDDEKLDPATLELLDRSITLAAIAMERRRFESALEYQAMYDPLTGLPNRTLLRNRVADALSRADRLDTGVAVLFIDLDRFRVINDSVGHAAGDELLKAVTERFRRPLRPGDTLGRFGGDSFVVVCARVAGEAAAVAAAERFLAELEDPFEIDDGKVFVSASIGIALAEDSSTPAENLVRNADVAMYRAKDQGRNQHVVFQETLDGMAVEQLALEQALRAAIENDEFELHYQPAVRLADGAMTKVEALVRWLRPGHGLVSPGVFIPLAEETGLIVTIGRWVLEEACRRAAAWPVLPGGDRVEVAVNLSARQLADPAVIDIVRRVIEASDVAPDRLCFEVTESALVHDVGRAVATLERLKELGVKIAIDDFGTGYATLDYVRHFSMADYLKIDKSFVDGVEREGSQEAAIVRAAIALGKSLGLTVVAEGVETLWQMEALRALDCDLAQGFLFSRPVPAEEAMELLSTHTPI